MAACLIQPGRSCARSPTEARSRTAPCPAATAISTSARCLTRRAEDRAGRLPALPHHGQSLQLHAHVVARTHQVPRTLRVGTLQQPRRELHAIHRARTKELDPLRPPERSTQDRSHPLRPRILPQAQHQPKRLSRTSTTRASQQIHPYPAHTHTQKPRASWPRAQSRFRGNRRKRVTAEAVTLCE